MNKLFPLNFSYHTFESADGTDGSLNPVIFLHGFWATKEMWEDIPQIIADKTKRKTYAYDARNFGGSDYGNIMNSEINIDDLFYFMDTMNVSKAIIVGHSMGGITACRAALKKPERVEMFFSEDMYVKKLTEKFVDLLACATDLLIRAVKSIPDSMNEIEARKFVFTQLFSQAQIKDLSVHFDEKGSNFHTDYVLKRKPDGSYDVSFNKDVILKALKNYDTLMPDPSGVFSGPAYFLYGNRSFMNVEADEENIKKHFPSAELIKFEGVSHNIHIEDREKFLSIILDRLTQRKC